MAAVMLAINERVHVDLSNSELEVKPPSSAQLTAHSLSDQTGNGSVSPISLVGSISFPFYLAAMRRPDLARDPRFATPEDRRRNLDALHEIVQRWIWTFEDLASLDAQLDEAKIAIGAVRDISETCRE